MAAVLERPIEVIKIGKLLCSLELGQWTIDRIIHELIEPQKKLATTNEKLCFLAHKFIKTAFFYESCLPLLANGILRVRFATFDCITFIYIILALVNADNLEDFVFRLYKIRYKSDASLTINNNPADGNIFDFACESLMINATQQGILQDITEDIITDSSQLIGASVHNLPFRRAKKYDPNELLVAPKFSNSRTKKDFILASKLAQTNLNHIQSGDLVLFTQGSLMKTGVVNPTLVNHLAIAIKDADKIHFIHSTMSFFQYLESERHLTSAGTGVFYDKERLQQQAGVDFGGEFIAGSAELDVNGTKCYAYSPTIKRSLVTYAQDIFFGVAFYRPL